MDFTFVAGNYSEDRFPSNFSAAAYDKDQDLEEFSIFHGSYTGHTNITEEEGCDSCPKLWEFIILGVGISTFAVLGTIGNVLSVIVLSNHRMRSSISCLFIGLAVCDTVILIMGLISFGVPTTISYFELDRLTFLHFGHLVPFIFGISVTAITGSVYFTLAVTLERYLAVCQPFFARRICTWRRASMFALGIWAFATLYNIPRWWEYACDVIYDPNDNTTVLGCNPSPTDMRKNYYYDVYYVHLSYFVVHYIIPTVFLIVMNGIIFHKIRQANKARRVLSSTEAKETSLANMLFIVVAVFLVCNGFPPALTIWKVISGNKAAEPRLAALTKFLLIFNSAVNFLIYCAYGEKFREVFLDLLPCSRFQRFQRNRQESDSDIYSVRSRPGQGLSRTFTASVKTICENV